MDPCACATPLPDASYCARHQLAVSSRSAASLLLTAGPKALRAPEMYVSHSRVQHGASRFI